MEASEFDYVSASIGKNVLPETERGMNMRPKIIRHCLGIVTLLAALLLMARLEVYQGGQIRCGFCIGLYVLLILRLLDFQWALPQVFDGRGRVRG
jgi:hypothetical protein